MKMMFEVLLRGGRWLAAFAVLAGAVTGVATMGMIAVITRSIGAPASAEAIVAFVGAALLVLLAGAVASNALVRVTQTAVDRLRLRIVDDVLDMTMRRFERYGSSRIMSILTDDLTAVGQAVQALPLLLVNSLIVASAGVYVGYLSWQTLLLIVLVAGVGAALYGWAGRWASSHLRRARDIQDRMHESLDGVANGFKDIKLSSRLRTVLVEEELRGHSGEFARAVIRGSTISLVTGYWGQLLFLACIGVVVFAAPFLGIEGRDQFAITLAVLYMNTPLVTVLNIMPVLSRATIALDRIREVGSHEERDPADSGHSLEIVDSISLNDVVFGYAEGEGSFRVGPVSHTFRRGTVTFLVGGNGSGKSTLGKVAAGLYPPDSGSLCVDGVPVDAASRPAFREHVSACFADSYVFPHVTGDEAGHAERLRTEVENLGLSDVVDLDGDRLVYEGLSSGQRKRLALAKILADPQDVVLFDEWAAEQDPASRTRFYEEILPRLRAAGRIVIVISHDDRFFGAADAIVKLERGLHVSVSGQSDQLQHVPHPSGAGASISKELQ